MPAIQLYPHNQVAFENLKTALQYSPRTAVIQPTGTGKSFVALALIEENPHARFLYLAPSNYIFRQLRRHVGNTTILKDTILMTYQRLCFLSSEEKRALAPDYIILDEFHRCGAEMWGKGVERLLSAYPEVPVLGLSATNIRYLDNHRDMADELFDGNIASEMTLGEAVVRGILTPPEYVLSIYSCSKDIEKYQKRIRKAKTKAMRDEAQKKLEAMRRSLENAEGLDVMFQKHIKDRQGKYIIFCANVEHLHETETHICEWFSGIDGNPAVYKAYSEDAESSTAFDAFRSDSSSRLKLLLCIDMLNEGVHIDGVSGVILLRPTVSPIIYKQQIGRALAAGSRKNSVIIDVVNNIENLYSVSAIQQEMTDAINYYRGIGQPDRIVNETFTITDETRDSKQLFCELEETLSASWDSMYLLAKDYYEKHHNLEIERRYVTPDGYALGSWLNTQRRVRSGKICGILTEERIKKLDAIGMDWRGKYDLAWEKYYNALCKYKYEFGNIDIKANYVAPDGTELGAWVSNLRTARNSRRRGYYLTDERIAMLGRLGMIWDKIDFQWEKNYQACVEYYKEHRNLDIPAHYATKEGLRIGAWIGRMRKARDGRLKGGAQLTKEQIQRLDAIGMEWRDSFTQRWEYGYAKAKAYYEKHGNIDASATYVTEDGFPLGKWLKGHVQINDKTGRLSIKVTAERKAKLDALGFKWDAEDSWAKRIAACKEYKAEHGDLNVSQQYVTADGIWLGKWLYECRRAYKGEPNQRQKSLTDEQIQELNALGMDWRTPAEQAWEEKYKAAAEMLEKMKRVENKTYVKTEYPPSHSLRQWISRQKSLLRQGKLTNEQINKLHALNVTSTPISKVL